MSEPLRRRLGRAQVIFRAERPVAVGVSFEPLAESRGGGDVFASAELRHPNREGERVGLVDGAEAADLVEAPRLGGELLTGAEGVARLGVARGFARGGEGGARGLG